MPDAHQTELQQEWITLQNNIEQYEKNALLIKLAGVAAFLLVFSGHVHFWAALLAQVVLWGQEAIFRTFQTRLGDRILKVETALRAAENPADLAFQLHSEWLASRKGLAGLLLEYLRSALRPTVAFPYVLLLAASLPFVGPIQ